MGKYVEPSGYFNKEMKKVLGAGKKKSESTTSKPATKKTATTKKK